MVVVSYSGKEINAKLVYYGPGLSGKTTNLEYIYQSVPSGNRGKMVSMKTRTERTLFFDFLPIDLGDIGGFKTRFLLYTVPGQVYYNATRKLVLRGVDAVIFVADSGRGKMEENIESLQNLRENLREYGLSLEEIPWVLQYNKRDLPDAYTLEELEEALNPGGIPYYEAVATTGQGVFECFRGIARLLLQKLSKEIKLGPGAAKGATATPSALVAGDAPAAPAAAPPAAARPAPPAAPVPPGTRPYRPAPPAGADRPKPAGRPTFPFPGQGAAGAPTGAPRPLSRVPAPGGGPGAGNGDSGISADPFATGDAAPPRQAPPRPAPAGRVPPPAAGPEQAPAFLKPRAPEPDPIPRFDLSDEEPAGQLTGETIELESPMPASRAAFPANHDEPSFAAGETAPSPSHEALQSPLGEGSTDDERLRRAAELAERLREAEAREAEREARKEGGLLGRLFRRRSKDREAPVEETPIENEGFVDETPQAALPPAPRGVPRVEPVEAEFGSDPFGGTDELPETRYEEEEEEEEEEAMAPPSTPFSTPAVPLPPVVLERRVRVPVTVSAEDVRRGVKLQLILDLDIREDGADEDDEEAGTSRVA